MKTFSDLKIIEEFLRDNRLSIFLSTHHFQSYTSLLSERMEAPPAQNEICCICFTENKTINCPRCEGGCCRKCGEDYLEKMTVLICPNCKQTWSYEFLVNNFRPNFLGTIFKQKEVDLLFDQERAQFETTVQQPIFQQLRVFLKYYDFKLKKISKRVSLSRSDRDFLFSDFFTVEHHPGGDWDYEGWDEDTSELKKCCDNIFEEFRIVKNNLATSEKSSINKTQLQELREYLVQIYNEATEPFVGTNIIAGQAPDAPDRRRYRNCSNSNCRGYNWEELCQICSTRTCIECDKKKFEEHICKREDIQTVQFLMNQSKPCPNCKTPIVKNGGCSMMYCVRCKTNFDWNTGLAMKMTEWFHNPELEDEQRRERRQVQQEPEAEESSEDENPCEISDDIKKHRIHEQYTEIPMLINKRRELLAVGNLDLRCLYINNLITEREFRENIYHRWKLFTRYEVEIEILLGIQSKLLESFLRLGKVRETDYGQIYREANDAFKKIAQKTNQPLSQMTLKEGFVEQPNGWRFKIEMTDTKKKEKIQSILYHDWFMF